MLPQRFLFVIGSQPTALLVTHFDYCVEDLVKLCDMLVLRIMVLQLLLKKGGGNVTTNLDEHFSVVVDCFPVFLATLAKSSAGFKRSPLLAYLQTFFQWEVAFGDIFHNLASVALVAQHFYKR